LFFELTIEVFNKQQLRFFAY